MATMGRFYYATSQKPTAVVGSSVAAITGPSDLNLVLAKTSRIDLYNVTDEGIQPIAEYALNGRIATLKTVRLNGKDVDYIMATTEHQQFLVLYWDPQKKALSTIATGDLRVRTLAARIAPEAALTPPTHPVQDRIGKIAERTISLFDPNGKCAAVHLCEGLLKIVPCERGFREKAFNVRMDELQVLDICFLHQQRVPTLAVLYRDMGGKTHVGTYIVSLTDRVLTPGPWPSYPVEGGPHMLIPIGGAVGGVIVVGKTQVKWFGGSKGQETQVLTTPPGTSLLAKCYGAIDDSRILLGDQLGNILLLTYTTEAIGGASMLMGGTGSGVTLSALLIDNLGRCVLANTINYLDGGLVFVGSTGGDHHLIQIRPDRDPATGKNFTVKQTWAHCGPIVDLCVQDLDRSGQGQVITASGVYEEGSMRVVRNGIGIEEVATIELPGIRNVWALKASTLATHHKYLIQSYASSTRVLVSSEESLEEGEQSQLPALDLSSPSLYCGNLLADLVVQVTAAHIHVAKAADMSTVFTWSAPSGVRVTVATGNVSQLLVALSNKEVRYFTVDPTNAAQPLVQQASRTMPHEVACMSVQPLGSQAASSNSEMDVEGAGSSAPSPSAASFGTIGLWVDVSLHVVNLAADLATSSGIGLLQDVSVESVGGAVPPRSTLLATMKGVHHAFLALADGHLYSFRLASQDATTAGTAGLPKLLDKKGVQLGRQPIALSSFFANGSAAVFAACDRPTVVHATGPGKLTFSNVNVSDVTAMCVFSTAELPDCLALASESGLLIGQTDELRKLHVKTVSLGEQPKKVAHFKAAGVVAVATEGPRPGLEGTNEMVEAGSIRIFDETTFEPLGAGRSFDLDPMELILAMTPVVLGERPVASSSAAEGREAGKQAEGSPYLAVGTCYILPGEEEPSKGRLLILGVEGTGPSRRLHLVSMREVRGGVYTLAGLQGGKLVAGINSKTQVYKWDVDSSAGGAGKGSASVAVGSGMEVEGQGGGSAEPAGEMRLVPLCGYTGYTLCLYVETRGDFILVGDLMKSVTLLRYNPSNRTVEVVAQDPGTLWCTSIALHDDTTVLVTDHHHNLLVCERDPGAPTEEERARLAVTGEFHLGEYVNRICSGSLVMLPQELEDLPQLDEPEVTEDMEDTISGSAKGSKRQRPVDAADVASGTSLGSTQGGAASRGSGAQVPRPRFIVGTVSGAIGVLLTLPNGLYKYLERLQWAMSRAVPPLGGLSHGQYRAFYSERASLYAAIAPGDDSAGPKGVIDGDLLEQFLDLAPSHQQKVVDAMNGVKGSNAAGGMVQVPSDVALHPNGAGAAAGPATIAEVAKALEDLARLH